MRNQLFFFSTAIIAAAFFYLFIQARENTGHIKPVHEGREKDEGKDLEANEDFFLMRSYPDAFVDMKAYDAAMKDVFNGKNTTRDEQPWMVEGPNNIGGRINCAAMEPGNTDVVYVGNASGGIFKTTNGGLSWTSIFDNQPYLAIGAITVDPNNPQTVWAGTGDLNISGYPFIGNGIYKSTDGGTTWTSKGLTETRIISKIIVDPTNSDVVYASTMGIPFETNNDRGLYKSTDAGNTWNQILFVDLDAGIIDMVMDPTDHQTIYAASWNRVRNNEVSIVSGPDAHIYKTTDGGSNWTMLTSGLPQNVCRIGLAISQQDPQKLYAIVVDTVSYGVEGIYKTINGGTSWTNVTGGFDQGLFGSQGWYFGKIYVNPTNDEEVYVPGVDMQRSLNGGNSWSQCTPAWWYYDVHADGHFIEFEDGNSFYYCTDGGMYKTDDDCNTWFDIENIPNTQFYHVAYNPFNVETFYGGAQDNGTTGGNAAFIDSWERIYGGDGFKAIFDPEDEDLFYVETQNGNLSYTNNNGFDYYDFTTGIDFEERRSWDMPYLMSQQDNSHFFCGTYRVYEMNFAPGGTWNPISDDLTDGQISEDRFHVITCLDQSSLNDNYLYAGTSDGNVWSSTTGGTTWNNLTPLLPDRYVTSIHASPNEASSVYVTHSGYKDNDYIPHVHKSPDNGQTWIDISGDLPQMGVNDLLVVPGNEENLFVATDAGVYYTKNHGLNWVRLGNNMPMMAVYDIELNLVTNKLIAGTFARSIWSMDVAFITGVENPEVVKDLNIYPNPVNDLLSVKVNVQGNIQALIFDTNGKNVLSKNLAVHSGILNIPVAGLGQGIYLLQIKDEKNKWAGKFIKVSE